MASVGVADSFDQNRTAVVDLYGPFNRLGLGRLNRPSPLWLQRPRDGASQNLARMDADKLVFPPGSPSPGSKEMRFGAANRIPFSAGAPRRALAEMASVVAHFTNVLGKQAAN